MNPTPHPRALRRGSSVLLLLAVLAALLTATAGPAAAAEKSDGLYAIPYEPGTTVHVGNDHLTHSPAPDRIDMSGTSGGPYRVVAAASGTIRRIEDSFDENGPCSSNNYVWIEHPNGEWTKYSHMEQGSVTGDAGLSEGESIAVGTFLGIESNIGCADGDHVHFEVGVPTDPADPINPVGGYIKGVNRVPQVCGIPDNLYVAGQSYTVPDVRPGFSEYARHGVPHGSYQEMFDAARRCGYRLDWVDGFERGGQPHFNALFRPSAGQTWASYRRLSASELDAHIADYVDRRGYELVHLDAYTTGSTVRYAVIFNRSTPLDTTSYHGLSAAEHQDRFDDLTADGWRPRVISVGSVGGTRTYAAVYALGSIGSWQAKSFQTGAEYQANYNANAASGRGLIYLNSYLHDGEPRFTAIWSSQAGAVTARHGMSSAQYQQEWEDNTGGGWTTAAVTAYERNGATAYAAYWRK